MASIVVGHIGRPWLFWRASRQVEVDFHQIEPKITPMKTLIAHHQAQEALGVTIVESTDNFIDSESIEPCISFPITNHRAHEVKPYITNKNHNLGFVFCNSAHKKRKWARRRGYK